MRKRTMRVLTLSLAALGLLASAAVAQDRPVTVFAAASMTTALEAFDEVRVAAGAAPLRFSFAASSTLARQIEAGAAADIFISANEEWMDHLEQGGLIDPESRTSPIGNSLVLIAPAEAELPTIDAEPDLAGLLGDRRIAVGDPDHVPAGRYAREALETLGQWAALEPRLARTDDVRAALALVERGETPLGVVYSTDVAQADVQILWTFPAESHTPITYPFALTADSESDAAHAVFNELKSEAALGLFESFGFIRN